LPKKAERIDLSGVREVYPPKDSGEAQSLQLTIPCIDPVRQQITIYGVLPFSFHRRKLQKAGCYKESTAKRLLKRGTTGGGTNIADCVHAVEVPVILNAVPESDDVPGHSIRKGHLPVCRQTAGDRYNTEPDLRTSRSFKAYAAVDHVGNKAYHHEQMVLKVVAVTTRDKQAQPSGYHHHGRSTWREPHRLRRCCSLEPHVDVELISYKSRKVLRRLVLHLIALIELHHLLLVFAEQF
jgi:hypothetical protein